MRGKPVLLSCATLIVTACAAQNRSATSPAVAAYEQAATKIRDAGRQDARTARTTVREAARELEGVVAEAPNFAPALALLAEAKLMDDLQNREGRREARRLAERALALSRRESRGHAVLGWLRFFEDYRYADARLHFERALALDPSDEFARYGYGLLLTSQGQVERGLREVERAERGTAIRPNWRMGSQAVLFFSRRFREAADRARSPLTPTQAAEPDQFWLGAALLELGDPEGAVAALEQRARESNRAPGSIAQLAIAYAAAGRIDDARAIVPEIRSHLARIERTGLRPCAANPCYLFALVDLALGDRSAAVDMLARAIADDPPGIWNVWLRVDPRMDPLRGEPGFAALLTRAGFGE